jgi:hypothetical protein
MGVVMLLSDNEALLTDRCLSQLRRYRGDQTDRPLCMVVDRPDSEMNYLELRARHPLVNMYLNDIDKEPLSLLVSLFVTALRDYPEEELFLWAAPNTYFTQPPRIQVATHHDWALKATIFEPPYTVHNNENAFPVPEYGYVVFRRAALEELSAGIGGADNPALDTYHFRNCISLHGVESASLPLQYWELWVLAVGWVAYDLKLKPDTSTLWNKLGTRENNLTRNDLTKLAILGNRGNL